MLKPHKDPPLCGWTGCINRGWHWIEDPKYPHGTMYLCDDHVDYLRMNYKLGGDLSELEYLGVNSAGHAVEIAEYACRDGCLVCWQ